ncbi:hypothetical protein BN1221_03858c [Brenneria goodwinii]|uniref:Uncharacterized protein n=1 Tax=Brenneria goodwinii TaxID=1109412 RepID=A0A0G4JZS1_9GAMM|nr:hypothetical protein BN1221_03858c [Brenneria goodwinii]
MVKYPNLGKSVFTAMGSRASRTQVFTLLPSDAAACARRSAPAFYDENTIS